MGSERERERDSLRFFEIRSIQDGKRYVLREEAPRVGQRGVCEAEGEGEEVDLRPADMERFKFRS